MEDHQEQRGFIGVYLSTETLKSSLNDIMKRIEEGKYTKKEAKREPSRRIPGRAPPE